MRRRRGCHAARSCSFPVAASSSSAAMLHPDPDAPTVLLLHGWTASADLQFMAAYRALGERFSFVGIDHRGHGRGFRSTQPFELDDVADDAAAVAVQLGISSVIAVGYSMGGPVALAPHPSSPGTRVGSRGAGHRPRVAGPSARTSPVAPAAGDGRSVALVDTATCPAARRGVRRLRRFSVRAVSALDDRRDDAQRTTSDGASRARVESLRRPSVGINARCAGRGADFDAGSSRQAAQTARARRRAGGADRRGADGSSRCDRDARSVRVGDGRARVVGGGRNRISRRCRRQSRRATPSDVRAARPCR